MKKIAILLFAIFAFSFAQAQDKAVTLNNTIYYYAYSGLAADTISNNDSIWEAQVLVNKAEPVKYSMTMKLDSVSGTIGAYIFLQGKVFDTDTYTAIDTVTWSGTSSDTTFTFSQVTTAKYYRYFKIKVDSRTGTEKMKINYIKFKFWDK